MVPTPTQPPQAIPPWYKHSPFEANFAQVGSHRMHFVDESDSADHTHVLLFVHGNPTWSFHWRELIRLGRQAKRCIAVDHLGCGLSDVTSRSLRLSNRIQHLMELIEHLDLKHITLVAQDWGGAIGLGAALSQPDRFERIILFNTGAFPPWFIPWRIHVCRWPLVGRLAVQGGNLFSRVALRMTLARKRRLPADVEQAYLAPYCNWHRRKAVYEFVEDIPLSPKHPTWQTLVAIEQGLESLAHLPVHLIWGMQDWCFTPKCLDRFIEHWPHADVHRIADAGHWVVEDAAEEVQGIFFQVLVHRFAHVGKDNQVSDFGPPLNSLGQTIAIACALEATAPKPGNVHPAASFHDLTYEHMLASAAAIAPVLQRAHGQPLGKTILLATETMCTSVQTNAHLGTILLLSPLATADADLPLQVGVKRVLERTTPQDTEDVYAAIGRVVPGGLGEAERGDVRNVAPAKPLVEVMGWATNRDAVALQFVSGFERVFDGVATALHELLQDGVQLLSAIVHIHVSLMAQFGDSLILRKCGHSTCNAASSKAQAILSAGEVGAFAYEQQLAQFDAWLREEGNRRNPGTTADLIAAGLFVLLREQRLSLEVATEPLTRAAPQWLNQILRPNRPS